MSPNPKFIIVDDDPLNNKVSRINIRKAISREDTITFTKAEDALEYLVKEYTQHVEPAILLLDINMPGMNGWEFLERYKTLNEEIKNQISIYILSSSIDMRDVEKARANQYVTDFISKPLDHQMIRKIASSN